MKRVYDKDMTVCPRCSGRMLLREVAVTAEAITRVLARHELWPRPSHRSGEAIEVESHVCRTALRPHLFESS